MSEVPHCPVRTVFVENCSENGTYVPSGTVSFPQQNELIAVCRVSAICYASNRGAQTVEVVASWLVEIANGISVPKRFMGEWSDWLSSLDHCHRMIGRRSK